MLVCFCAGRGKAGTSTTTRPEGVQRVRSIALMVLLHPAHEQTSIFNTGGNNFDHSPRGVVGSFGFVSAYIRKDIRRTAHFCCVANDYKPRNDRSPGNENEKRRGNLY